MRCLLSVIEFLSGHRLDGNGRLLQIRLPLFGGYGDFLERKLVILLGIDPWNQRHPGQNTRQKTKHNFVHDLPLIV